MPACSQPLVKFVNWFLRQGGVKHYRPSAIMTGCNLHRNNNVLGFEVYCQIAKNVEPWNSLAPRTRVAISLGNSGNLTGGQLFLALDTGAIVIRHQWVVPPVQLSVIDYVNFLGQREPFILTFTSKHGQNIDNTHRMLILLGMKTRILLLNTPPTPQEWPWIVILLKTHRSGSKLCCRAHRSGDGPQWSPRLWCPRRAKRGWWPWTIRSKRAFWRSVCWTNYCPRSAQEPSTSCIAQEGNGSV